MPITPVAFSVPRGGVRRRTRKVYPYGDCYLIDGSPTANTATSTSLLVGSNYNSSTGFSRYAVLCWRYVDIARDPVVKALLTVTIDTRNDNIGGMFNVWRILQAVDPATATWNQYRTGVNWNTGGARGVGVDVNAANVGIERGVPNATAGVVPFVVSVDVTGHLADAVRARTQLALLLVNQLGNGNTVDFGSLENATVSKRPYLTLTLA